jgi:hypothetical protein
MTIIRYSKHLILQAKINRRIAKIIVDSRATGNYILIRYIAQN